MRPNVGGSGSGWGGDVGTALAEIGVGGLVCVAVGGFVGRKGSGTVMGDCLLGLN
jgi:hypothetical protein